MTENQNPECPDHTSHWENAADRLFPGKPVLTADESVLIDHEAEAEYQMCEGH